MPRPKRRVASRRTAAPVPSVASPTPTPTPPAESTSSDIYDVSDREKEKQRLRRESQGEVLATRVVSNRRQAAALAVAQKRRDSAMERLDDITSTSTAILNTADDESDSSIEIEVGRRAAATPAQGRMVEVSGLDLDDDMFADLNTSFDTAGPASAQRSNETSTMSASRFKRRPRAGSFLSTDHAPIRPSSRAGPNTPGISTAFNIGVFKRRAREPSILGTAQKDRPQRPEPDSDGVDESDDQADEESAEHDARQVTKVTTADLTGLLPRRRHRNARADALSANDSEDEVDVSGLGNDDDELSYLDVRTRRRPAMPLSRVGTANQSSARGKGKQTPASTKQPKRTYGRPSSDKENKDEDDEEEEAGEGLILVRPDGTETSEELQARVGEELKLAARKFQEVDKWELEYEEMTQSSSPRDAR
ncbi:uncharacterized protein BCR38DRAFT_333836 [Pseudomassariella vexata]|uniref:Uncharacterized protein n=1 Tax=Pseudomassariella vexata TaxID=1141098 RepID=A0A1Y2EFP6_9PEZI|nr:uncharacterized protein BCR38DRAFT_333836 [Pseudomassariella vexata]ORY70134.1 hypothetical protein BCR38DRAFT_333836 [Pseudomassariella vexata]